jgi:hypothetical protein
MANAVVGLDDGRFASNHSKHAALGAYVRASLATDAVAYIDVRMLAPRPLGKQLALGSSLARSLLAIDMPYQIHGQR